MNETRENANNVKSYPNRWAVNILWRSMDRNYANNEINLKMD